MVNEPLRTAVYVAFPSPAVVGRPPLVKTPSEPRMRPSKPLMANSTGTDSANAAVQSALRTLEAEGSGIAAIEAALRIIDAACRKVNG